MDKRRPPGARGGKKDGEPGAGKTAADSNVIDFGAASKGLRGLATPGVPSEDPAPRDDETRHLTEMLRGRDYQAALSALEEKPCDGHWGWLYAWAYAGQQRWDDLTETLARLDPAKAPDRHSELSRMVILRGRSAEELEDDEKDRLAALHSQALSHQKPKLGAYLRACRDSSGLEDRHGIGLIETLRAAMLAWPNDLDATYALARAAIDADFPPAAISVVEHWPRPEPRLLLVELEANFLIGEADRALEILDQVSPHLIDEGPATPEFDVPRLRAALVAYAGRPCTPPQDDDLVTRYAEVVLARQRQDNVARLALCEEIALTVAEEIYPFATVFLATSGATVSLPFAGRLANEILKVERTAPQGSAVSARLRVSAAHLFDPEDAEVEAELIEAANHPAYTRLLVNKLWGEGADGAAAVAALARAIQRWPEAKGVMDAGESLFLSIALAVAEPQGVIDDAALADTARALAEHRDALTAIEPSLWGMFDDVPRADGPRPSTAAVFEALSGIARDDVRKGALLAQAGYHSHVADPAAARRRYRECLVHAPRHATALSNLLLLAEGDLDATEAAQVARRLYAVKPSADLAAKLERLERQAEFQATALARWPSLDQYKRRILAAVRLIKRFSFADLSRHTGIEHGPLRGHWDRLVGMGMILENETRTTYLVNPVISPLVDRENTHALAVRVVRGDASVRVKPVFNSAKEYQVYKSLLQVFPNMLVFPNISLQSVMPYEAMKAVLTRDEFDYYLMASADYGIVSTGTYLPILCIELDSPWHDTERQQTRDMRKDRIFAASGIPLVRVRVHGDMSEHALHGEIVNAMGCITDDFRRVASANPFAERALEEVEAARDAGRWGDGAPQGERQ